MKIRTFRIGGIHPEENKLTHEVATQVAPLPKQAIFPLSQHIGAPAKPVVAKGDKVKVGTLLAEAGGFVSAPIYSSVSGTVFKVDTAFDATGYRKPVIIVNVEGDEWEPTIDRSDKLETLAEHPELTPEEIVERVKVAGVTGMGGAGFPTFIKLCPPPTAKAECVIINAVECEPYITSDDTLLRTNPEQVLRGMQILQPVVGAKRAVLAVEDNKPKAIAKVRPMLDSFPGIELAVLPTRYPQGAEKQLIQAVTGREVPPGQLPVSVNCAVFNVSTFAAIYRAVELGVPVTSRIVTVSGEAIREPQNFIVRIGTPFRDLIEVAGGLNDATERVICGGPMMGISQGDLSIPVMKSTNCVLCLLKDRNAAAENPVCLRCGKCVGVCPMRLQPRYLYRYQRAGNLNELERLHVTDCIECGSCAFTCPGKLPLVETIRAGKQMLKEAAKK